MSCWGTRRLLIGLATLLLVFKPVRAWEIRLKDHTLSESAVIRLGDVSEISGLDERTRVSLERIPLTPGPTTVRTRVLTTIQIREVLTGYGVELDQCCFSGPPRVVVSKGGAAATGPDTRGATSHASPHRLSDETAQVEAVRQAVCQAVMNQLPRGHDGASSWEVEATIARRPDLQWPDHCHDVTVEGIESPKEGRFPVVASFRSENGVVRIPAQIQVQQVVEAVVATGPIQRGQLVRSRDVALQHVDHSELRDSTLRRLEEVVGRQATQTIQAGSPVDANAVQMPLLVKRGDLVNVVARCGGIQVEKTVKATQDGAIGDSILVQNLGNSKVSFVARVTGVGMAEVYVSGSAIGVIARK